MILTLDLSDDSIDVGLVLGGTTVGSGQLAVGGLGSAVTVGEIVDDDLKDSAGSLGTSEVGGKGRDLSSSVEPDEGRDLSDLSVLGLEAGVGDGRDGSVDLVSVVWADVARLGGVRVASGRDGGAGGSRAGASAGAGRAPGGGGSDRGRGGGASGAG